MGLPNIATLDFTTMKESLESAKFLSSTNFCPQHFFDKNTSQWKLGDIITAVQYGAEIGFSVLQALNSINVINGKPSLPGDTMLALCMNSGHLEDIRRWFDKVKEVDGTESYAAIVEIKRRGVESRHTSWFSIGDAKRANKWGNAGPWSDYAQRMLMYRALGFALRDMFPDVLKGLISSEEAYDYPELKKSKSMPIQAVLEASQQEVVENEVSEVDIDRIVNDIVAIASVGVVPDEDIDKIMRKADILHLRDIQNHPEKARKLLAFWNERYSEQLKEMNNG